MAITAAAVWMPALAPALGSIAPLTILGKYVGDKIAGMREQRAAARSLMGVLALAKDE